MSCCYANDIILFYQTRTLQHHQDGMSQKKVSQKINLTQIAFTCNIKMRYGIMVVGQVGSVSVQGGGRRGVRYVRSTATFERFALFIYQKNSFNETIIHTFFETILGKFQVSAGIQMSCHVIFMLKIYGVVQYYLPIFCSKCILTKYI